MKPTIYAVALLCACVARGADVEVRNKAEFLKILSEDAELKQLATGMRFTEGPVWVPSLSAVVFSDIPSNELKKWSEAKGLESYRKPSNKTNGNTLDRTGNIISCEHGSRRVSIEKNGRQETLVDRFKGKRFNSPNDAAVKSDGSIWFTDPPYGLRRQKEGKELDKQIVFRFDPKTQALKALVEDFDRPNGICFSPDEKKLYVADSGKPHHIRVFNVVDGDALDKGKILCVIDKGVPDGIRCDAEGRLWVTAGDGVHVFSPAGELIGKILVPESPANLCFGGEDGKTLFITARKSLYAIRVLTGPPR